MQINSHDLVAWPLFAKLSRAIKSSCTLDVVEELRKIAVEVDACTHTCTCPFSSFHNMNVHDHVCTGRSWNAVDTTAI